MSDNNTQGTIVSDEMAKKFASEKETPYVRWVRDQGLDIIDSVYVKNLYTVDLKPWARREGKGVYLNHDASRTTNDCYVCEIDPGKKLAPQRMLFEEMIMILSGRGSTSVWNDKGDRITFEWGPGALFAIPLNCWHQHFNASGQEAARFVAVTNAPPMFNVYEDPEFVFNTAYDFKGRFNGEPDYFAAKSETDGFKLVTNFVPDAVNLPLITAKERGAVGRGIFADVAGRRGAEALPVGSRHHDRAAEHVVASAFQHRPDAVALSCVQIRRRGGAQRAGRAEIVDFVPHRRRSDRLCG